MSGTETGGHQRPLPPIPRMSTKPVPSRRPAPTCAFGDDQIVEAIRRGDGSVARSLYDRLQPAIEYALCRVLRHRGVDFDDLVQVSFERVIRAIAADRFSGQSALSTWAAAIAGHVAIDHLRRSRVERRLFDDGLHAEQRVSSSGVYWTERSLEARSEIAYLHAVLSKIKPRLTETILLHDVLGYSIEEVAVLIGASHAATRSRLFRGRRELVRQTAARRGAK